MVFEEVYQVCANEAGNAAVTIPDEVSASIGDDGFATLTTKTQQIKPSCASNKYITDDTKSY